MTSEDERETEQQWLDSRDPDRPTTDIELSGGLGWWVIEGGALLAMLRRAHDGEDPDLVYAEEYANCDHEAVE